MNVSIEQARVISTVHGHELESGMVVVPMPPKTIDLVRNTRPWYTMALAVPHMVSGVHVDPDTKPHRLVQFMAGNTMVICGANRAWYRIK